MAKYTTDFKLSVIAHYQSNHSYKRTARQFGLDHKTVELWVKLYQTHGIDGIKRRHTKALYDTDFKLNAVKQLLNGKTAHGLAIELGISTPTILLNWLKRYQTFGIMGLTPKPKGRKPMSNLNKASKAKASKAKANNKSTPNKTKQSASSKSQDDEYKQLLRRLEYLEAENDYLKKLDALIHQYQTKQN